MKTRIPSLMSLKAFEAVARHGSFKIAAEELFVTPGALSQQVKKLESDLGFVVFEREHRKISLTDKGSELKGALTSAFIGIEQSILSLRAGKDKAPIKVSCGAPVAAKWLAPRLGEFSEKYPDIPIEVMSDNNLVNYQTHDIDIGIRLSRDEDTTLDRVWLHEETAVAVCTQDYADRYNLFMPHDILNATLLKDDGLTYCRGPIWELWCKEAGLSPNAIKKSIHFGHSPEQAIDAVLSGSGVMIASKTLVSLELERKRLIIPFGPEISTHVKYQVVTPKIKLKRREVQLFQAWLLKELKPFDFQQVLFAVN